MACGGVGATGERILSTAAIDLMRQNQLGETQMADFNWPQMAGYGYGLGVRTLVEKIEARSIDITGDYEQWVHLGMSLHDMICGLDYWQRISVYRRGSHANDDRQCAQKWKTFKSGDKDNAIGYFFNICRDYGITLR